MLIAITQANLRKLNAVRRQNGEPDITQQYIAQAVIDGMIQARFVASGAPQDKWGNPIDPSAVIKRVTFVYDKNTGSREDTKWRTLDVTEEDSTYIRGYDVEDGNKFKAFLKSKILGGRAIQLA